MVTPCVPAFLALLLYQQYDRVPCSVHQGWSGSWKLCRAVQQAGGKGSRTSTPLGRRSEVLHVVLYLLVKEGLQKAWCIADIAQVQRWVAVRRGLLRLCCGSM